MAVEETGVVAELLLQVLLVVAGVQYLLQPTLVYIPQLMVGVAEENEKNEEKKVG